MGSYPSVFKVALHILESIGHNHIAKNIIGGDEINLFLVLVLLGQRDLMISLVDIHHAYESMLDH